jgi:hypothetical protein
MVWSRGGGGGADAAAGSHAEWWQKRLGDFRLSAIDGSPDAGDSRDGWLG